MADGDAPAWGGAESIAATGRPLAVVGDPRWWLWVAATATGWIAATALDLISLHLTVDLLAASPLSAAVKLGVYGLCSGLLQAPLIARILTAVGPAAAVPDASSDPGWAPHALPEPYLFGAAWVLATTGGWVASAPLIQGIAAAFSSPLLPLGATQCLVLRRRLPLTSWWMLATLLSGFLPRSPLFNLQLVPPLSALPWPASAAIVAGLMGAGAGAITGAMLLWLAATAVEVRSTIGAEVAA
ncbi:MAG: hypothetical protein QOF51_4070 [Chloroflexota bacterium]|jgi:hypothetical protein|nr:hypothetical protein [Chloroflexota bacterium]